MGSLAPLLFPVSDLPADSRRGRSREHHAPHGEVPSLLKWTGSKRSQAERIASIAPEHDRYFEPFLGGGALLFCLARPGAQGSDIYAPLVAFWKLVRDEPEHLIQDYTTQWKALQDDLPGYFYVVRERFNNTQKPEDLNFLMRTCVNGIVRFSKSGQFNNSFHLSRRGMIPKRFRQVVMEWTARLRGVDFRACDYAEAIAHARQGDFVYLDPPYSGNRQRYIGDLNVERLYEHLENLNRRRVKWALSFDGNRGDRDYKADVPIAVYKRVISLDSGYSAVAKVLNGPIEQVTESLYLNY
ncbi:MAG: DNA adenine methylase [Acidocella sp.]|nr:DNA adenine methylase [Acidocella sp.]